MLRKLALVIAAFRFSISPPSPLYFYFYYTMNHFESSPSVATMSAAPPPLTLANASTTNASHPNLSQQNSETSPHVCPSCGVNQQRLALLQEHVSLESQLLKEDKRNFKRRLKAAKASARKTQVHAENQLLLVEKQTKESEQNVRAARQEMEAYKHKLATMQHDKEQLVTQLEQSRLQLQQLQQQQIQKSPVPATSSSVRKQQELHDDEDLVQQMQLELEEKQAAIDGYEMQLLEMERELDNLRNSNHGERDGYGNRECTNCRMLQIQLDQMTDQMAREEQKRQLVKRSHLSVSNQEIDASHEAVHKLELELQEQVNAKKKLELENAALSEKLVQLQRLDKQGEDTPSEIHTPRPVCSKCTTPTAASCNDTVHASTTKADTIVSTAVANTAPVNEDEFDDDDDDDDSDDDQDQRIMYEKNDTSPARPLRCMSTHPVSSPSTSGALLVFEKEYHGDDDMVGMYTGYMILDTDINSSVPHGVGTLRLEDGGVVEGDWNMGLLHGEKCVLATIDGDLYIGGWLQGKKNGEGTLVYSDGRVYRGQFQNDCREGVGYIAWPYGAHYRGDFNQDLRSGQGEYRYADGRSYVGNYYEDRPQGYGVLRARDGTVIYEGQWELGEFLGNTV